MSDKPHEWGKSEVIRFRFNEQSLLRAIVAHLESQETFEYVQNRQVSGSTPRAGHTWPKGNTSTTYTFFSDVREHYRTIV